MPAQLKNVPVRCSLSFPRKRESDPRFRGDDAGRIGTLRLGDIQFLNSWPVTYALRQGIVEAPVEVALGTPAELNRRLLTGEMDASAVSSLAYLRHAQEWVPIPGLCIRSDSGVHSVLVVSRQPLSTLKGRTVGVSNQGATTPVLLKLLSREHRLKLQLEVTPLRYPEILEEYPAALLIGDEALQAAQSAEGLRGWDLGQAWSHWTHRPFVYALWVARRAQVEHDPGVLDKLRDALWRSYEWGRLHRAELIAAMRRTQPFEANFLRRYLEAISYDLDAKAWGGLVRFSKEAEVAGELPRGTTRRLRKTVRPELVEACPEPLGFARDRLRRRGRTVMVRQAHHDRRGVAVS